MSHYFWEGFPINWNRNWWKKVVPVFFWFILLIWVLFGLRNLGIHLVFQVFYFSSSFGLHTLALCSGYLFGFLILAHYSVFLMQIDWMYVSAISEHPLIWDHCLNHWIVWQIVIFTQEEAHVSKNINLGEGNVFMDE